MLFASGTATAARQPCSASVLRCVSGRRQDFRNEYFVEVRSWLMGKISRDIDGTCFEKPAGSIAFTSVDN